MSHSHPGPGGRANPFVWQNEEAPTGVFVGAGDDGLALLGLPQGFRRADTARSALEAASANGHAALHAVVEALQTVDADANSVRIELDALNTNDIAAILDLLGEGEVNALIATESGLVQAQESVFPGVWLVRPEAEDTTPWIEIGAVPALARAGADAVTRQDLPLEHIVPPDGAMNVMGVLAEIRHVARTWKQGDPNHVMNFSLLPMTEVDVDFLAAVLGQGPVRFASGGYGSARIISAGVRRVWAVQYLNSMGVVILDTIEIGDIPAAACAAREDFEDSAARLADILREDFQ